MTSTQLPKALACAIALLSCVLPAACGDDGGADDDGSETGDGDGDGDGDCMPEDPMIDAIDESGCNADADDYTPTVNMSADDMWPVCVNDDGDFHPLDQPSAAARTEAFEEIMTIFDDGLTDEHFTDARDQYSLPEGLESRLARREDVHYPDIPEADREPGVDFDKQCTIMAIVDAYPDRCAGPAKIQPIINQAFDDGQTGTGDPAVNAARIEGALTWFSYLSIIKEATYSCPVADKSGDCDAAWGYYNGGRQRGAAIGFGRLVMETNELADERTFDGLSAMRCWRNGYADAEDADTNDGLYAAGYAQLDQANNAALARVVRERMANQPQLCGSEGAANWAFVQTAGQGLIKPAEDTDAGMASTYKALLANDAPTTDEIVAGVAALDALFPCP